ncbi:MAG TPA: PH domain-containing protein [Candidatus Saccharimonadales bacterium]|nr:PH domain-containing protein [Candidatus Saccharimonadales bacterium]
MEETPKSAEHRAEAVAKLSSVGKKVFKFIEFDDDEELLAEIRKHPIGLVFIWLTGFLITATIVASTAVLGMSLGSVGGDVVDSSGTLRTIIIAVGLLLGVLSLVITLITAILYQSNVVFVTNEKIAEVMYVSIFNRRVMQLGIGNVEDATVSQKGILPRLFDYGSLVTETAGEMANPAFTYVPKPNYYAQLITQAHENYVEKYGN